MFILLVPLLRSLPFCVLILLSSFLVSQSHFHFLSVSLCLICDPLVLPLLLVLLFTKRTIAFHLCQLVLLSLLPHLSTFTLIFVYLFMFSFVICSFLICLNLPSDVFAIIPVVALTEKFVDLTSAYSFNTELILKTSPEDIKDGKKKNWWTLCDTFFWFSCLSLQQGKV